MLFDLSIPLSDISRAGPNSLADLVRVEVVVHQLVDDVVRVLVDELQAHRLKVGSNIITNLG